MNSTKLCLKILTILCVSTSLLSCVGSTPAITDIYGCAQSLDSDLLADADHPDGFVDIAFNQAYNLPWFSLLPQKAANLRVLSINVGNGATSMEDQVHPSYDLRLTYRSYEEQMAQRIQALSPKPHIIALQEVLSAKKCQAIPFEIRQKESDKACWQEAAVLALDQVQRLVGPEYAVICDGNEGVDCLAVLKSYARIDGLEGDYNPSWKEGTAPFPPTHSSFHFDICQYANQDCDHHKNICDQESSVARAHLVTHKGDLLSVIFVHPTARGENCLQAQIEQVFQMAMEDSDIPTLILGDWNMDPQRFAGEHSLSVIFYKYVGPKRAYRLHDNFDSGCVMTKTSPMDLLTLDHVVTNFAHGICHVYRDNPETAHLYGRYQKFDEGILKEVFGKKDPPSSYLERSMDHKAVLCDLRAEGVRH